MNGLFLLLACLISFDDPPLLSVSDHVDCIELNHYFDSEGQFVLNQLIYFSWSKSDWRFQVNDYKLQKHSAQIPFYQFSTGIHHSFWYDGQYLRKLSSNSLVETWSQKDPEYLERRHLKNEKRSGLATVPSIYIRR